MRIANSLLSKGIIGVPKQIYSIIASKYYKKKAISSLKSKKALWSDLNNYLKKTQSSGCSFIDYSYLYDFIIKNRPKNILECGTGVTTIVMAHALKDAKIDGQITSMESHKKWYEMSKDLLPKNLNRYVEFVLSPVIEDYYSFFRGSRYTNIPEKKYDLVFVDGPSTKSELDGTHLFNYDFFHILKKSDKPIQAIIDKRLSTVWFLQKVLGEKVSYDPIRKLGFVEPSTKYDIRTISKVRPSLSFEKSVSVFSKSKLDSEFNDFLDNDSKI